MRQFINRIFNRVQVTEDSAIRSKHYVYINGVAYMRSGILIAMCDFTLPPKEQKWKLILNAEDHPGISQIAYALALIEGAIELRPAASQASRGIGLN